MDDPPLLEDPLDPELPDVDAPLDPELLCPPELDAPGPAVLPLLAVLPDEELSPLLEPFEPPGSVLLPCPGPP